MPVTGCLEAMEVLNLVSTTALILNDGHEILERIRAGDDLTEIANDLAHKFGRPEMVDEVRRVVNGWPQEHLEAVREMVGWALGKLDTEDRITIRWKGDAESPDTFTRFELRDHTLLIEFAHPPSLYPQEAGQALART